MKTKTIALSLAAMMSVQTVGFANADRTAGMEIQAVRQAQQNMEDLRTEILKLDQSLEASAKAIEKRDSRGGITNGFAVAAAGIGVGLSAASYLMVKKGGPQAGVGGLIIGTVSVAISADSFVMGGTSQLRKTKVDTKELETQLSEAQKNVDTMLAQNNDKATASSLTQLNLALKNVQSSLQDYQDDESETTVIRLASQTSQLLGVAMMTYAITQRTGDKLFPIGILAMNAGNLGALIYGFQGGDAKEILKEIQQTRDTLKVTTAGL